MKRIFDMNIPDPMMLGFQIVGWFILSAVLMSFIEHQVHKWLMHRRSIAAFKHTFEAHAIVHHKNHYSKIFSDAPVPPGEDKEIRLTIRKAPIKALPVAMCLAFFSWLGAAIFIATFVFHHWVWNNIHLEMHKPEQRAFSHWRLYQFLARYHWLHHRYPDKNFNVVFPLADFVLGTLAHATPTDLQDIHEQIGSPVSTALPS
ncbi:hypothetical protein [Candidatus Nitronereus thalassa]|uniref:Fatty acid hydroxylase domain-containing protein n=1 Tax=Candidatus Nitronereus thalassa TaxID=3020898 RepID=A0ABU3K8U0_9BACT|nr:hypothetical protein [Candidatus Nitronereus thalassa]MDT7042865.1 hypothetical protein [Candidatus Nitronereus thalassa]